MTNRKMVRKAAIWAALLLASSAQASAQPYVDAWVTSLSNIIFGLSADSYATLEVWRTLQQPPYSSVRVNTNIQGTHSVTVYPKHSYTTPATSYTLTVRFVGTPGNWNNAFVSVSVPIEHCLFARLQGSVQPGAASAYPEPAIYYKETAGQCTRDHAVPEKEKTNCPIVLDLERDGYHLAGPTPALAFDIDADGIKDQIGWTAEGEDDAFLCWDRNGNGRIDDGTELFGWATPLAAGTNAGNGYVALADLDKEVSGGDGDGELSPVDVAWSQLCVWTDLNHDGESQVTEVAALSDQGLLALEYDFNSLQRRDAYGNVFRYSSSMRFLKNGKPKDWPTYDIVFAE